MWLETRGFIQQTIFNIQLLGEGGLHHWESCPPLAPEKISKKYKIEYGKPLKALCSKPLVSEVRNNNHQF